MSSKNEPPEGGPSSKEKIGKVRTSILAPLKSRNRRRKMKLQLKEDRKRTVQKDENDNPAKVMKNQLAALEKENQPSISQSPPPNVQAFNPSSFLQIQRGWQRFKFGWRYVEIHRNEAGKEKVSIYGPESKEWIQFVKFVGPPPQE